MIKHSEKRHLKYSSDQMFNLVADIESYPAFIPWCREVRTTSRDRDEGMQCEILEADMRIAFKVFSESFSSKISLDAVAGEINVEYLTGPFNFLSNRWVFTNVENGCLINFDIKFEFKSRLMQRLIGVVFHEAMKRVVQSFERRADELYK